MAGGRRSGSANKSRKRQNSDGASHGGADEYCPNCDRGDCDDSIPTRALWWIVTLWDGKILMDKFFASLGLLWLFKPICSFVFPNALVIWLLKFFCRFISVVTLLEENVPFFLFFEFFIPFFAVAWFLTIICWRALVGPTCTFSYTLLWQLGWIVLYDIVANPTPGPENWSEVGAQIAFFIFLLLSTMSSDTQPLNKEDIAFIKDFGGCDCSSQRKQVYSEEESHSIWAFESQVREDMLDVLPAFHLLQAGIAFDDLPQQYKMKVLNFLKKEMREGKTRFEYRSGYVCSCSSSQGASGSESSSTKDVQIVSATRIKHQAISAEISVQVIETSHPVKESNFDRNLVSLDSPVTMIHCDTPKNVVLPPAVVNKTASSTNENVQATRETNQEDNELEELAKTVTTFELDQVNPSQFPKDNHSNKDVLTNDRKNNDVQKSTNIEELQLSRPCEDDTPTGKRALLEKIGRKKRSEQGQGGRVCGRKDCLEKGTQLCSR